MWNSVTTKSPPVHGLHNPNIDHSWKTRNFQSKTTRRAGPRSGKIVRDIMDDQQRHCLLVTQNLWRSGSNPSIYYFFCVLLGFFLTPSKETTHLDIPHAIIDQERARSSTNLRNRCVAYQEVQSKSLNGSKCAEKTETDQHKMHRNSSM